MENLPGLHILARIHTDFPTKFGIPRQSGIVEALKGVVVFEPCYRNPVALRGLEDFSHIWLIWLFSQSIPQDHNPDHWSPTVRPPRLGGNQRMGVFATRSPFRPNPIGLSSVKLEKVQLQSEQGPLLHVSGVDLMDGTPILDIKPYLPFSDSHPEAAGGFAKPREDYRLEVIFPPPLLQQISPDLRDTLIQVLAQDPRPSYQKDPRRIYGFVFAKWEIRFVVEGNCLRVCQVEPRKDEKKGENTKW